MTEKLYHGRCSLETSAKEADAEASAFAESNFAGNLGEWLRDPVPLVEGIWPAAVKGGFYPCCRFLLDGGKTNRLWFQHSQLVFFSVSSFAFNCTEIEERGCSRGAGRCAPPRAVLGYPWQTSIGGLGGAGRWVLGVGGLWEPPHGTATLQDKAAGVVWRENGCHALIFLHKVPFNTVTCLKAGCDVSCQRASPWTLGCRRGQGRGLCVHSIS